MTELWTKGVHTGFSHSGKPGEIPHVSLVDVLEGRIPLSEFADSLVFVGVYAPGFQDPYNTSAARGQQMYGVEINANIFLALMNQKLANPVTAARYAVIPAAILALWLLMAAR